MKNILKMTMTALTLSCLSMEAHGQTSRSPVGTPSTDQPLSPAGQNSTSTHWDTESSYWHDHYSSRPYYNSSRNYSLYEPAYRYGVDLYNQHPGVAYEDLNQSNLSDEWDKVKGNSTLMWSEAQDAVRDAYKRLYDNRNISGNTTNPSQDRTR